MTTPTGPDDDRLRAAIARLEGPRTSSVVPSWQDPTPPGCTCTGGTSWHALSCPARQQPPAQEREVPCSCHPAPQGKWVAQVGPWHQDSCRWSPYYVAPPSEADSAGESDLALARLRTYLSGEDGGRAARIVAMLKDLPASVGRHGQVEHVARFLDHEATLAASSGVRGGDDQARERLADVLALHQSLGAQNVWCGYDGEHWPCATVRAAGGGRP